MKLKFHFTLRFFLYGFLEKQIYRSFFLVDQIKFACSDCEQEVSNFPYAS
jgi:hypothetical protein